MVSLNLTFDGFLCSICILFLISHLNRLSVACMYLLPFVTSVFSFSNGIIKSSLSAGQIILYSILLVWFSRSMRNGVVVLTLGVIIMTTTWIPGMKVSNCWNFLSFFFPEGPPNYHVLLQYCSNESIDLELEFINVILSGWRERTKQHVPILAKHQIFTCNS